RSEPCPAPAFRMPRNRTRRSPKTGSSCLSPLNSEVVSTSRRRLENAGILLAFGARPPDRVVAQCGGVVTACDTVFFLAGIEFCIALSPVSGEEGTCSLLRIVQ